MIFLWLHAASFQSNDITDITEQNLTIEKYLSLSLSLPLSVFLLSPVRPVTLHAAPPAALPPCGAGSLGVAGPVRAREEARRAVQLEVEELVVEEGV